MKKRKLKAKKDIDYRRVLEHFMEELDGHKRSLKLIRISSKYPSMFLEGKLTAMSDVLTMLELIFLKERLGLLKEEE